MGTNGRFAEKVAVITPVEKVFPRRLFHITLEERHQVVAVEMNMDDLPPSWQVFIH